ncbi:erythroferrone isoform X1 [Fundulus heteroclitus]|uniref:erythroferrone isoform X1 n=1 Tax=Fundulus heteroclitus TaxID=8078 RepID=UPI00165B4778|nr:erythroferrone isoform X1 [Fundulus heteroclitus]
MPSRFSSEPALTTGARLLLLLGLMVVVVEAASVEEAQTAGRQEVQEVQEEEEEEEEEMLEPASSNGSRVSPRSSWLLFRRNSNKGENRRTKASRRTSKHGLPGPPGPPGPQGPPGLPAPLLPQQQELIQQLKLKLGDLAGGACLQCHRPPRVSTSFFSRLLQAVPVPRRSLLELQPFGQPSESERSLQRGPSFNSSTGRYTAPISGFYQLTASLLIESGERVQVRLRDSVRAAVCIESLCQSNLSVESVMGAAAAGGTFSILLTGTLYLQAGEYVSVFVDNATGSAISVLQDSLFSGILLGI